MGKITDDELKRIDLIKQDSLEIASILGELTYQKINLENQIDEQRKRVLEVKTRDKSFRRTQTKIRKRRHKYRNWRIQSII